MDPNAEDIYNYSVRKLSPKERLRLAVMILNELLTNYERIDKAIAGRTKTFRI